MSAAIIRVETDIRVYTLEIRVEEAGSDPLPMLMHAAFRQLCDGQPEIMGASNISVTAQFENPLGLAS